MCPTGVQEQGGEQAQHGLQVEAGAGPPSKRAREAGPAAPPGVRVLYQKNASHSSPNNNGQAQRRLGRWRRGG